MHRLASWREIFDLAATCRFFGAPVVGLSRIEEAVRVRCSAIQKHMRLEPPQCPRGAVVFS